MRITAEADHSKKVIIANTIWLYRDKAPFVASGVSIKGGLEYDEENDIVRRREFGSLDNAYSAAGLRVSKTVSEMLPTDQCKQSA